MKNKGKENTVKMLALNNQVFVFARIEFFDK